jgi:hypothetical protein
MKGDNADKLSEYEISFENEKITLQLMAISST